MSKYRDELVQTIKLMGQELIDRAESMVHEDCDMITNFNINIDIPQPMDGHPELTWSTSAISKNFYNKELGHSAGDAKMETHVETVTVEKKPIYITEDPVSRKLRVEFFTRIDSQECLDQLERILDLYSLVSVADLYDLCGIRTSKDALDEWGWITLESAKVDYCNGKHIIDLPAPILLK